MKNTAIVFMGTPDFAVPILQSLCKIYQVTGVVTQPDRSSGRTKRLSPPPVKVAAEALGLPVIQPVSLRKDPACISQLQAWAPAVIVVAAYGQILPKTILALPEHGCVNVHASLLPRWRGAAPINAAIYHGEKQTGISIMQMDEGLDTGAILSQRAIEIGDLDAAQLSDALSILGAELLLATLPEIFSGKQTLKPQEDALSSYAPMLKKEDGYLDTNRTALELLRQIQAFKPWPGSFLTYNAKQLKVFEAEAIKSSQGQAGERLIVEGFPALRTKDGILVLRLVQPAGKKAMAGDVFVRGARDWASSSNI